MIAGQHQLTYKDAHPRQATICAHLGGSQLCTQAVCGTLRFSLSLPQGGGTLLPGGLKRRSRRGGSSFRLVLQPLDAF